MNIDQTTHWRNVIARVAPVFFVFFCLSALDGLVSVFRQPLNAFPVLPGETIEVNGPLKNKPNDIGELKYDTSADKISLSFQDIHPGFWMGGTMWRGVITVDPNAEPGDYEIQVGTRQEPSQKPTSIFKIRVCRDRKDQRSNSLSLMKRYLALSPWWIFGFFFMLTFLSIGTIYLFSHRREYLLRQEGKAEIYRIVKKEKGLEISFALGRVHGILPGAWVSVFDKDGRFIVNAGVCNVYEGDSIALVEAGCKVLEGDIVASESFSNLSMEKGPE